MNRISVNHASTFRWQLFQDVLKSAKLGFDGIGLVRHKVEDFGEVETVDLIHEMQIGVSSLSWVGGFTGCAGMSFDECVQDAKRTIQFAAAVEAECLIVHPGSRNSHTWGHATRLLTNALDELIPFAQDYDVTLALEPMAGEISRQWSIMEVEPTIKFVAQYSEYELGLVLDLFHMGECSSLLEDLESLLPRIKLVQLGDTKTQMTGEQNRCRLGAGRIPISEWISRLDSIGYEGTYEVELHGFDVECEPYCDLLEHSLQYVKRCLQTNNTDKPIGPKPSLSVPHRSRPKQ